MDGKSYRSSSKRRMSRRHQGTPCPRSCSMLYPYVEKEEMAMEIFLAPSIIEAKKKWKINEL